MYNELNAFGKIIGLGQSIRVAFDRNMSRLGSESGASFVLEFTLRIDGHVYMRQATASAEQGLVLATPRQLVPVALNDSLPLSNLLRMQHGEVYHPGRAGKLSFRHKGLAGVSTLSLHWEAGKVQATPPVDKPQTTNFRPSPEFDRIVAPATRVQLSDGLWFPVFGTHEQALSFCRFVGGFARRVVPGAVTRSHPIWSDKRGGFIAELSVQFPGWGEEKGIVLCRSNEVAGLALVQNSNWVLLPVKKYSHTLRTRSGTLYVLFSDGTAFCRSQSDGALESAHALYFARSYEDAHNAYENGGAVQVTRVPTVGFIPLYVSGEAIVKGDVVHLNRKSFRRGTAVASVNAA